MMHVLISDNATGKTRKLHEIADKYPSELLITNMSGYSRTSRELNPARVWLLDMWADTPITPGVDYVSIDSVPSDICNIVSMFLLTGDYIVVDEPDLDIPDEWSGYVYEALFSVAHTYKECWIASHNIASTLYTGSEFYSCDKDEVISREEAVEILDTF